MLHAKFQGNRSAGSGEDFLKVFCDLDHLYKPSSPLPKEALYEI